ncbi:MAG: hypothetical protein ACXVY9_03735 [Terriglobales bacterium]
MTNIRKLLCAIGVAGALCVPAFAQYQPQEQPRQHDQDDMQRDRDQNNVQRDQNIQRDRDDAQRDRDNDRDRANVNNGYYNQNNDQWRNTKAWKQGFKDGQHDRSRNMGERLDRHHWRNDQDRQAYQAGYYEAFRGSNITRDRDDQRRDRDDH